MTFNQVPERGGHISMGEALLSHGRKSGGPVTLLHDSVYLATIALCFALLTAHMDGKQGFHPGT